MTSRFLLDANLSSRSRHWQQPEFELALDHWDDHTVWQYAAEHNLIIVTKDVDFEERALRYAPPQVIRFCTGNMRRQVFRTFLAEAWPRILAALAQPNVRLVKVYADHLEMA